MTLEETHAPRPQAEDWVFRCAVKAIGRDYGDLLSGYLATLVPGR